MNERPQFRQILTRVLPNRKPRSIELLMGGLTNRNHLVRFERYQVKGESDPKRESNPGYIVRLVGQVVRVSVETARIVKARPDYRSRE
jgi:hypothetical protein